MNSAKPSPILGFEGGVRRLARPTKRSSASAWSRSSLVGKWR